MRRHPPHQTRPPRHLRPQPPPRQNEERAAAQRLVQPTKATTTPAATPDEGEHNEHEHRHIRRSIEHRRRPHQQRLQAARKRWHEYPRSDLETRGGYIVDRATGHCSRASIRCLRVRGRARERGRTAPGSSTSATISSSSGARQVPAPSPNSRRWKRPRRQKQERERRTPASSASSHAARCGSATSTTTRRCRPSAKPPGSCSTTAHDRDRRTGASGPDPRAVRPGGQLHVEAMRAVIRAARVLDAAGESCSTAREAEADQAPRRPAARPARRRVQRCRSMTAHKRPCSGRI